MPGTRKLGRTSDHRKAMLRAMVTFLFETGKIETTATRAKEVRAMAEKMVTLGKREDLHAKRQVYGFITKESVAKKVIDEIGPRRRLHPYHQDWCAPRRRRRNGDHRTGLSSV
jgi:large subunit ribosomal protein L17